jgi:hypothetical protein
MVMVDVHSSLCLRRNAPSQHQQNVLRRSLSTSMGWKKRVLSVAKSILGSRSVKSLHRKKERLKVPGPSQLFSSPSTGNLARQLDTMRKKKAEMLGDLTESADKLRTVSNLKHPRKTRTANIKLPPKPREGQGKEASGKVGARYQSRVHSRHLLHGVRRDAVSVRYWTRVVVAAGVVDHLHLDDQQARWRMQNAKGREMSSLFTGVCR